MHEVQRRPTPESSMEDSDFIDQMLSDWTAVSDHLNLSGSAVVARIVRMNHFISKKVATNFDRFDINVGEYDALAALLRSPGHELTPGQLQAHALVSSGGLSNRINRLEEKGLISRRPDPGDRRGVIVSLTERGEALTREVTPLHLAVENSLIDALSADEQKQLTELLRKMLRARESKTPLAHAADF